MPTKAAPNDPEPPSYAKVDAQQSSSGGTEHRRSLESGKGRKWLSLVVKSRSSNHASLPVFFEGDKISGRVEVDLDKAESAKAVTVSIQGGTTFVGQEEEIFLKEQQVLWTPSAQNGSKLTGKQSWPFSFVLPAQVLVKEIDGKQGMFRLPPNFTERASAAYIDYKMIVTVQRGMLKVNQVLSTNLGYHPATLPDYPSALRQLAYSEGSPLVGPDGDPEGWKTLPAVRVKGALFNVKDVEVECMLSIAKPLSYALGSSIPLMVTFTSSDLQALDVLANPAAIKLRLMRSMATGLEATDDNGVRRTDNHFQQTAGMAYFWPSREGAEKSNKRVLQGELELVRALKPSFKFPNITIRYTLDLLPFTAAGFVDATNEGKDTVLLSESVNIATRQIPGLVVRSYAPPGYEKPLAVDYNNSLGLLENGNQRFAHYHHHG
ncbi:hypothetical protein B0H34DRAFT_665697 [Crassisporium funariophilum]|nr:hypothetical protein B0H34DRAFT_665697 [Crassisporium funariophilum]